MKACVRFIEENTRDGAVYIHCALGHGRSVLFVAAYLIHIQSASTADRAVGLVRQKRANIELHPEQMALLQRFASDKQSDA